MISVLGVRGFRMLAPEAMEIFTYDAAERVVDRDDLLLSPALVESYEQTPEEIVHDAMDQIWQAAGWDRSPNFSADHKWELRR